MYINTIVDTIEIKEASITDVQALQTIGKETFHETFASSNTENDMKKYLEESFSTTQILSEIRNPHNRFYIAWLNQGAVGYLKLVKHGPETDQNDHALEIKRLYVKRVYHGKKVGQLLYNKALEVARENCIIYLWLAVWEKNERAISFYEKNGFVPFGQHRFQLGNDEQTGIMMRLSLN